MNLSVSPDGRFRSSASTHVGTVRSHNEDRFVNRADLGLWAVADGAGGHHAGELAAGKIAELLEAMPSGLDPGRALAEVRLRLAEAHRALRAEAARRGPGAIIASTVVVLLARDAHFACLWAGDSRAYLWRNGTIAQLTRDHSLVEELLAAGAIDARAAQHHPQANVITRAVGAEAEQLELDKVTGRILPGDRFLLCSDGLSKTLSDADLASLLEADHDYPAPERLVCAAVEQGVTDNVTAVAVEAMSS